MEKVMKIQEQNQRMRRRIKIDGIAFALICIAIGLIFLGRNTGFIDPSLFGILISWQMLLVVLGLYSISHKIYMWGIFVAGVGLFFMTPLLTGAGSEWIRTYWPLIFVFIGLLLLVRMFLPKRKKNHHNHDNMSIDYQTQDGFVYSDNFCSGTKHVVMDEIFKGAEIKNVLGGTVLDLRRTSLQQGDTFIDIECRLGGIELYVPENWLVLTELKTVIGGVSDERHQPFTRIDESYRLILRGRLSMSGVVIKN